jgi:SprT protein
MLPLAIGLGEGSEMLRPLAVTIVAGLTFSMLVSLLLVPVLYELTHLRQWRSAPVETGWVRRWPGQSCLVDSGGFLYDVRLAWQPYEVQEQPAMNPVFSVEFTVQASDGEFKEESIAIHSPEELFAYVAPGGGCEQIPSEVGEINIIYLKPSHANSSNPIADLRVTLQLGMVFLTGPLAEIVQTAQEILDKAGRNELAPSCLTVIGAAWILPVMSGIVVAPLSPAQRQGVVEATCRCITLAGELFGREFTEIPVTFELRGRAAGMYRVRGTRREIRYNPYIFARYFSDNLANTVPHEVAHYVTEVLHGLRRVRPHGPEWQAVMRALGAEPVATCRYDLDGLPVRRQRRFSYQCACSTHSLTTVRHNRVLGGRVRYSCRRCQTPLSYVALATESG